MKKHVFLVVIVVFIILSAQKMGAEMMTYSLMNSIDDIKYSNMNEIKYENVGYLYDKITIDNNEYFLRKGDFINVLKYICAHDDFDAITSEIVSVNNFYYKYDIYRENEDSDNIIVVFYKFQDEHEGVENMVLTNHNDNLNFLRIS